MLIQNSQVQSLENCQDLSNKQETQLIIIMVLSYSDVMEVVKILCEDRNLSITVRESGKGAAITGSVAGLGDDHHVEQLHVVIDLVQEVFCLVPWVWPWVVQWEEHWQLG